MKMRPGTYSGYDVIQWVIRKIEEEPKRLWMADWVTMFKGAWKTYLRAKKPPTCGTIACMAGWIGIAGGNVEVTGSWAGLDGLGLYGRAVVKKYPAAEIEAARNGFTSLFLTSDIDAKGAVARARILAETHKAILQTAKVKVGHGWH